MSKWSTGEDDDSDFEDLPDDQPIPKDQQVTVDEEQGLINYFGIPVELAYMEYEEDQLKEEDIQKEPDQR